MILKDVIRSNKDLVIEKLKRRNYVDVEKVNEIYERDIEQRKLKVKEDEHKAALNNLSRKIGELIKNKQHDEAEKLKENTHHLKEEIKDITEQNHRLENLIYDLLIDLPNMPDDTVPIGSKPDDNVVIKDNFFAPNLPEKPQFHWELADKYKLIHFEWGAKLAGAGFPVYTGKGAVLQRSLIQYFLDKAVAAGYLEIMPPLLVHRESAFGTGQLPDKDNQMYHVVNEDLYLVPTAEIPITNLYRDAFLSEDELPIKMCGHTACFRREAGSYGSDVRGLNRLHQFEKVELVQIVQPKQSYETLQEMVSHVENLLVELELPYRILELCTGDLGTTSAKTFDMEVWSGAQEKWLEVSSVSNFETFQSNRMRIRFKNSANKNILTHTLNGSALALPRILASILENNQKQNFIQIPKCLVKYTGFERIEEVLEKSFH